MLALTVNDQLLTCICLRIVYQLQLLVFLISARHDLTRLCQDVHICLRYGYAPGTVKNYACCWTSYQLFCEYFQVKALPITVNKLVYFIVLLQRTLCPDSVSNYLSALCVINSFSGHAPHAFTHPAVKLVTNTAKRISRHVPHQAQPITLPVLLDMYNQLDLAQPLYVTFWVAVLIGFFGLLRKSNLVPPSMMNFDPEKHLSRASLVLDAHGTLLVKITWSKTLQFRGKTVNVPIANIPFAPLSASYWVNRMMLLIPAPNTAPAFVYPVQNKLVPLTYSRFTTLLRDTLTRAGYSGSHFTGHSLRRGGATTLRQLGFDIEDIMVLGDWVSNSVRRYIDYPAATRNALAARFADKVTEICQTRPV